MITAAAKLNVIIGGNDSEDIGVEFSGSFEEQTLSLDKRVFNYD